MKDFVHSLGFDNETTMSILYGIAIHVDNEADFSNRKSILYGYNMKDGSMFQGLHRFQEESYLQEHNHYHTFVVKSY